MYYYPESLRYKQMIEVCRSLVFDQGEKQCIEPGLGQSNFNSSLINKDHILG